MATATLDKKYDGRGRLFDDGTAVRMSGDIQRDQSKLKVRATFRPKDDDAPGPRGEVVVRDPDKEWRVVGVADLWRSKPDAKHMLNGRIEWLDQGTEQLAFVYKHDGEGEQRFDLSVFTPEGDDHAKDAAKQDADEDLPF